jgi:signal peptidase II
MSDSLPVEKNSGAVADSPSSNASLRCCSAAWFGAAGAVLILYVLDQATKLWTAGLDLGLAGFPALPGHLELGEHIPLIPSVFHWVHFSNTGAAFGIMHDSNRFFIGLSFAALCGLSWSLKRNLFPGKVNLAALLLLMSGILGNLTDRILHGYVVDFLLFDFGFPPFNPWPAFNVADSCICVAVGLLLLASYQEARTHEKN